jgi:DNA adenine methylase
MFEQEAKPFLKWAGGKRQLLSQIINYFPTELKTGTIKEYVEPFVGGGAIFFHVAHHYQIEQLSISDINPELILAYRVVKNHVDDLIPILSDMQEKYLHANPAQRKNLFYEIRTTLNKNLPLINFAQFDSNWIERAAHLIFLNRTCFNGLFRVNSKGEFNVPFGGYKKPKICDVENLHAVARVLQRTHISLHDFEQSEKLINGNTFIYLDPPYRPISQTASFTSYSKSAFVDDDQVRLASFFHRLSRRKTKLMLSNSDPKNENPDDTFFEDLYKEYNIQRVSANRMINCDATKRGHINELLIMNYEIQGVKLCLEM